MTKEWFVVNEDGHTMTDDDGAPLAFRAVGDAQACACQFATDLPGENYLVVETVGFAASDPRPAVYQEIK